MGDFLQLHAFGGELRFEGGVRVERRGPRLHPPLEEVEGEDRFAFQPRNLGLREPDAFEFDRCVIRHQPPFQPGVVVGQDALVEREAAGGVGSLQVRVDGERGGDLLGPRRAQFAAMGPERAGVGSGGAVAGPVDDHPAHQGRGHDRLLQHRRVNGQFFNGGVYFSLVALLAKNVQGTASAHEVRAPGRFQVDDLEFVAVQFDPGVEHVKGDAAPGEFVPGDEQLARVGFAFATDGAVDGGFPGGVGELRAEEGGEFA